VILNYKLDVSDKLTVKCKQHDDIHNSRV